MMKGMGWTVHVACMGDEEIRTSGFRNLKEGGHLEVLDIDGRVILIWILK
jgi:hypothetical protein